MTDPGIIPAHAGSTRRLPCGMTGTGDHPRSRGEHMLANVSSHGSWGSSPLTRGAHVTTREVYPVNGIIPAHAGSTTDSGRNPGRDWDHPRSRGEHIAELPRRVVLLRIIPAHAGSTPLAEMVDRQVADHPRSRGEHRVRGEHPIIRLRIIPAHAGSTLAAHKAWIPTADHPRSRGEHWEALGENAAAQWIIPAHAGSTRPGGRRPQRRWDHPRSRGEHAPQCP